MKNMSGKAQAAELHLLQRPHRITGAIWMAIGAGYPKSTDTFLIVRTASSA
jgi:hypothetical protein